MPVRPIVAIASDDWGRSGAPSRAAVDALVARPGPWDYYGLDAAEDVLALTEALLGVRDRDGRPACLTANLVMANLDIEATLRGQACATERRIPLDGLSLMPISEGFPAADGGDRIAAYRQGAATGAFWPELHGLAHFCSPVLAEGLTGGGDLGRRVRLLLGHGIPYLASMTPELNFALVDRRSGVEVAISAAAQERWLSHAVQIFETVFGRRPLSFCAPGYRHDRNTLRLLGGLGVQSNQTVHGRGIVEVEGLASVGRNVVLEPVLADEAPSASIARAVRDSLDAAARGLPIVVCTHSINYVDRFNHQAAQGRIVLTEFLTRLVAELPDLRFASVPELVEAWQTAKADWFSPSRSLDLAGRLTGSRGDG